MQAVVNEDAVGTNLMLKAELQRVKVQLAAMHGQAPALDTALATPLAFDEQPNNAAAQAAQVRSMHNHPNYVSSATSSTQDLGRNFL